mmetsp:Transcript_57265/g.113785  ORF Transcript_57265/g.113785 Transcript_57265/m.113785 type:complete len:425 (+) Transcript_57265:68-1342(+)
MPQPQHAEPESLALSNEHQGLDVLGIEAQVDDVSAIQTMLRLAQCGTIAVEVWQGMLLVLLVQLKRRRMHMGLEACLNETVLGLMLQVLPKALPDAAPVLATIKPGMRTAMLRPPSCLLQIIDDSILVVLPPLVGNVLDGAAPSFEGMEVLRRLSTALMTSALSVVVCTDESAQESAGSGSQGSGWQRPNIFHTSVHATLSQIDAILEQGAPDEMQQQQQQPQQQLQRPLKQPPQQPQWLQAPQQPPKQRQSWEESGGVADLTQESQQTSSPMSDAWVSHGSHGSTGPPPGWDAPTAPLTGLSGRAVGLSLWSVPDPNVSMPAPTASQDADDAESLGSNRTLSTSFSSNYSRQTRSTNPSKCASMAGVFAGPLPAGMNTGRMPKVPQGGCPGFDRRLDDRRLEAPITSSVSDVRQEAIQKFHGL